MVFSSLIFLFAYLPLTLLCYYAAPRKYRNLVLFVLSLVFYGWGEPIYVLLMVLSIISAYLFGFLIERHKKTDRKRARRAMILSLAVNLSFLLFFKYYNFFIENISRLLGRESALLNVLMPLGISFFTFQHKSYFNSC